MKTVFITTSPKKKWSNSSYLLSITKAFTGGEKIWIDFRGPKDYPRIYTELKEADAVVFALPLYVDAVPSHVLVLLQEIERYATAKDLHFKVYGLCNCGFYEGEQCELALEVLRCWCERSGLEFCGGAGIGGGEMIGMLRLSPIIGIIAMLIEFLVRVLALIPEGFSVSALLSCIHPLGALIFILVSVLFSVGPWICAAKVGKSATAQRVHGIHYSTVSCCPAFLFAFFGGIYWIIRAFIFHFVPAWKLFRKV